jgi:uncharacterized ParB-like nuclease family protein
MGLDGYKERTIWLEIMDIDTRPASLSRETYQRAFLESYAENFDELPPIHVVREDDKYWTVDGSYRLKVAERIGRGNIRCYVKEGTYKDALADTIVANPQQGVPLTLADKSKLARELLMHRQYQEMTLRALSGSLELVPRQS